MKNEHGSEPEQMERGRQVLLQALSTEPTSGDHLSDDRLIALAEGRLWPWQRFMVRRHLRQCAPCTAFAIELRRTVEAAHSLQSQPKPESQSRSGRILVFSTALSVLATASILLLVVRVGLITPERLGKHSEGEVGDVRKGDKPQKNLNEEFAGRYLNMKEQRPNSVILEMDQLSEPGRGYSDASSIPAIKSDALYYKALQQRLTDDELKLQMQLSKYLAERAKQREQEAQHLLERRK